ncbi:MAG TPA: hypothetical protein VFD32_05885 [Dehalococcoidia bacterium]|nr:hypothetical protein [Dehalococcoidia bacterium]
MIVTRARVVAAEELLLPYVRLTLDAPELSERPRPGQFLMAQCGDGLDPFLPRPFFAAGARDGGRFDLLVAAAGKGSDWLAQRRAGDTLQAVGWCGRGVAPAPGTRHLLLGAAAVEIAALLLLVEQAIARGLSVTLVTAPAGGLPPYPPGLLPPEVEVEVAADPGPALAAALVERIGWADEAFVCGDEALLRALSAGRLRLQSRTPVWAQRWQRLPCGTGLCMACPVETRRGTRLLCSDGPWFALRDLA